MWPSYEKSRWQPIDKSHRLCLTGDSNSEVAWSPEQKIISSAARKILFLPHAIKQISRPDRMISTEEIREAIFAGEIIEEYPEDLRGESCLILYTKKHRSIHVVCAPKDEYLAIITAYLPAPGQWSSDFKVRR